MLKGLLMIIIRMGCKRLVQWMGFEPDCGHLSAEWSTMLSYLRYVLVRGYVFLISPICNDALTELKLPLDIETILYIELCIKSTIIIWTVERELNQRVYISTYCS